VVGPVLDVGIGCGGESERLDSALDAVVVAKYLIWVFLWKHVDCVAGAWSSVCPSRAGEPPDCAEETDKGGYANGVIHVGGGDRLHGREEEYETDEDDPCDGNRIHRFAPAPHGVGAWMKDDTALVPSMGNNDGNVADVQGRGGDVEDGGDG